MKTWRLSRQQGFTLLEVVVTLVVVSLLMALLMQALSQSLGLRSRLIRLQAESRQMLLQEAWFRESVATAQPPLMGEGDFFKGTGDELTFISAVPLVADGSSRVSWRLSEDEEGHVFLLYSDISVEQLPVIQGPLYEAHFTYADNEGDWLPSWETNFDSNHSALDSEQIEKLAEVTLLPRLVRFQAITAEGRALDWIIHLPNDLRAVDQGTGVMEFL